LIGHLERDEIQIQLSRSTFLPTMKTPSFVYFDMGNVLLFFDNARACRQMSAAARVPLVRIQEFFGRDGVTRRLETGQLDARTLHAEFCRDVGVDVSYDRLSAAACDMFWVNQEIIPLIGRLSDAGVRLGILSNTSLPHWEWVSRGRFRFLRDLFDVHALSFEIGAMKPSPDIFRTATELAGVPAEEILFTDDLEQNVQAARNAGWQAVTFATVEQLSRELHNRGIRFFF
jgi:putative hydrolase of the HAD superfamily